MSLLATLLGLLISAVGVLGMAAPETLVDASSRMLSPIGLYAAAALRIGFGLVLIGAARSSRLPRTVRALGALLLIAGVVTAIIGVERARAMHDWWSAQGPLFMQAWSAVAVAFGLFIVYAVRRRRPNR